MNQILPKVQEIEEKVISAFLRPENTRRIIELGVKKEMFTDPVFIEIFDAGVHLIRSGVELDVVILSQYLSNKKSSVDPVKLAELHCSAVTFVNLKQWVQQLREFFGRRQLMVNLANLGMDFANPQKVAAEVFQNLQKVCLQNEDYLKMQGNLPTTEQADRYLESLNRLQNPRNNESGIIVHWGIDGIDELCPLQRRQIFVLGAGVNTGKTRFALSDLAGTLMQNKPSPKVIFSKENPNRVIWDGLVSIISGVSAYNLNVANGLNNEQFAEVRKAVDFLKKKADYFRLYGKGEYKPTPSGIIEKVHHVFDYTNGKLADVWVDYIQNHQPDGKAFSAVEKVEKFIQELSDGIGEYPIALKLLSQLNRDKSRGNNRLTVNDLKGSSAIEQEADYIAFLQQTEKAEADVFGIDFYAVKTRSGASRWNKKIVFDKNIGKMSRILGKYEQL